MPPIRSLPMAKPPAKTERSHEENQERAYIAASRRSDRSLEARVESARRASEIHKRRTGRSLRVTEQDVVNEEMYEEEDDDLPLHYRRLTAHLNTNSPDFNRRLAGWLTNHVAMRNALAQAISSSYGPQQFAQQPWAQSFNPMQQPWANPQQPGMHQSSFSNPLASPTMQTSPSTYRTSPYPMPGQEGYRPNHHQRSASAATSPTGVGIPKQSSTEQSRTSPTGDVAASSGTTNRPSSASSLPDSASQNEDPPRKSASVPPSQGSKLPPSASMAAQWGNTIAPDQPSAQLQQPDISPLTTALPLETQLMFAPGFNSYQPFGAPNFNDFEKQMSQGHGFNPNVFSKTANSYMHNDGMNQTLAPSVLDSSPFSFDGFSNSRANDVNPLAFPSAFDQVRGGQFTNDDPWKHPFLDAESGHGSGPATPSDKEWATFIDSSSWDEIPSKPT